MAGATAQGRLSFELASGDADDAAVRAMLRHTPTPGRIGLTLEREPDARLAASIEGDVHHTILARENNRVVAMGSVSVRDRYLNGQVERIGYLGQLRLDTPQANRTRIILRGYEMFGQLHAQLGASVYLTSIASDNDAARRLLERGLPGMPTYRPLCELVTLLIKLPSIARWDGLTRIARPSDLPTIHALVNTHNARYQFSPHWSEHELPGLAQQTEHYRVIERNGQLIGAAAWWDQRSFKQVIVRSMPWWMRLVGPRGREPRLNVPLSQAFASHLSMPPDEPQLIVPLIRSLQPPGVRSLVVSFEARDPRLPLLRRVVGGREYRTQLYCVHWPDGEQVAASIDASTLVMPEVALL